MGDRGGEAFGCAGEAPLLRGGQGGGEGVTEVSGAEWSVEERK